MKSIKRLTIALCVLVLAAACNKNVPVSGISIDQKSISVNVGESIKLTAVVRPDDATNRNVIWSSSESNVATVDANGTVTGVKSGSAVIKVTSVDGAKTETCEVKVYVSVTGVTLDKGEADMKIGDVITLKATVAPEDATNKNVSWESGDPSVASVDNNGKVTALKEGFSLIQVLTESGSYTATCVVTVSK